MEWPSDPWLIATLLIAAVWFQRGSRRPSLRAYPGGRRRTRRDHLWRGVAFYAALVTILFALGSLDRLSEELFSVHMAQHILLMLVAAPLLALAAPWNAFWRPLPLGFRRAVAGGVAHSRTLAPGRRFRALAGAADPGVVALQCQSCGLARSRRLRPDVEQSRRPLPRASLVHRLRGPVLGTDGRLAAVSVTARSLWSRGLRGRRRSGDVDPGRDPRARRAPPVPGLCGDSRTVRAA